MTPTTHALLAKALLTLTAPTLLEALIVNRVESKGATLRNLISLN